MNGDRIRAHSGRNRLSEGDNGNRSRRPELDHELRPGGGRLLGDRGSFLNNFHLLNSIAFPKFIDFDTFRIFIRLCNFFLNIHIFSIFAKKSIDFF